MNAEMLLPAAFIAGFFGGTHCLAMCGPVVVLLESQNSAGRAGMPKRLAYNLGRMGFYVLLGAVAGASGALLTAGIGQGLMILRLLAGLLVILLGLNLAFDWQVLSFLEKAGAVVWKKLSPLAKHVLPVSSTPGALAAGFIWGALPCGLVYSAVALAASSGDGRAGGAVMLAFWAGTLPALLLAGTSAHGLGKWKNRPALRRAGGLLLIGMGVISIAVPLQKMDAHGGMQHGSCVDCLQIRGAVAAIA